MTQWLRAQTSAKPLGVDREARMIRGIVLAEEGIFKNRDRGEFDQKSIRQVTRLAKQHSNGLKSHLAHQTMSNDGIGKMLGRVSSVRDEWLQRDGREILVSRGDLKFSESAFMADAPSGNMGDYVMQLVKEDPENAMMSLVLEKDDEWRLDSKNRPKLDDEGNELPPIWRPTTLKYVDVVGDGEATTAMLAEGLSVGLPNEILSQATELLQKQFAGKSREFVREHLESWLSRALDTYFPEDDESDDDGVSVESRTLQLALRRKLLLTTASKA